ncbi:MULTISPECIES: hypothetical protein [Yersinia pseudotuberculosis complex]|uniref:hypothetical protein n=1 Tax=Yersinia pseudotuberculosis complex TaxID=1649845 RepID=UPI0005DDDEC7|nr:MULTISPECIES: hypothetical protein [Yersinia pseudotuberculosis complex]PSH36689.1 hypothetical protein BA192_02090 [Yersinia pseudotuberculosis]CND37610.1 Uncharacterised protein [Yersinia pseudotuberculosis]CNE41413.1 Uncharacterised protein [Yersinia similis]CQH06675.1 Uncharacterised protein [Yersinia pseudotuberculosis]
MSSPASWSYTAKATVWKKNGPPDEYGKQAWLPPIQIMCDYGSDIRTPTLLVSDAGKEIVVKDTIWTEYAEAVMGDFILIGISIEVDPITSGADEVKNVIRYADTFERIADDFAIITGV